MNSITVIQNEKIQNQLKRTGIFIHFEIGRTEKSSVKISLVEFSFKHMQLLIIR